MSGSAYRVVANESQQSPAIEWVRQCFERGLPGGPVKITIGRPEDPRTIPQNKKMWPMLNDISKQVSWYGEKLEPDDWKDLLGHEWRSQKIVPGISGGYVALGAVRTSKMKKREFCELIEILYAFGSNNGVIWSQPALAIYDEYRQSGNN